jgi:excisionase family DNA binding protein
MERRTLSAREAAQSLGVSDRTIRRAILEGRLVATKAGRSFVITTKDLERYRGASTNEQVADWPAHHPTIDLIGRERALATILEILRTPATRILTLTGPVPVDKRT